MILCSETVTYLTVFFSYRVNVILFSSKDDGLLFTSLKAKNKRFKKQTSHFAKLTHTDTWAVPGHASDACVYR